MSPDLPTRRIDPVLYNSNRRKATAEQLQPFWGKCVAWNAESTRIVASGTTWADLYARLAELGIDPCDVVDERIPDWVAERATVC